MPAKRGLSAAFALLLAVSFAAPSGAWAVSAGGFIYDGSPGGATVTGCDGICPTTLTIPDTLGGQPVTSIGDDAFETSLLTSVTIPDGVISIGRNAFYNNLLTRVTIPNSVTNIGENAFRDNRLAGVTIGQSVTSIGNSAFQNNLLATLTIPNSVTGIGDSAFGYNLLTALTIGNSVTSVGDRAFASNLLTAVTFTGNAPIAVDSDVFSENSDLTHVDRQFSATGWTSVWSEVPVVTLPELPPTDRDGSNWSMALVVLAGITAAVSIGLRVRGAKRA